MIRVGPSGFAGSGALILGIRQFSACAEAALGKAATDMAQAMDASTGKRVEASDVIAA
ncbi:hypothetical protein GRI58_04530 [Porphyrobacter algicida]|uniref:Uncharacterized protein n=1 Tax=Qipengyuania algicida TaxID=1836209 RepID=A0A845AM55_9SPHN|nr:hypothetical protein [Qipengyuania algicida]MXP28088.1 hypothetical protein [Qipengyuania algicida]